MHLNQKLKIAEWGVHLSAFLFFSLFLSVKGAYSAAMALSLLTSLWAISVLKVFPKAWEARVLAIFLLALAVFWSHSFDSWISWSTEGDFFIKYALGAWCAFAIATLGLHPRVLAWGLAVGCITSGMLAIAQFPVMGRAEGFTNAIKFGDISIYMGMACWILVTVRSWSVAERVSLFFAGCMGIWASLLSMSRGGWILLTVLPVLALYLVPQIRHKMRWFFGIGVTVVLLGAAGSQLPVLKHRINLVEQEVVGYFENPSKYVQTSIGSRLEHWRLSWRLVESKPLTGWGEQGYKDGKEQLLAQGGFHPFLEEIHHSHNDFLDILAKRGILGVLMMLLIYSIPIWIFYPTAQRKAQISESQRSLFMAVSLVGLLLPVGYFVFGWTDVFFNLTIGHNFYILSLPFILASITWIQRHHHQPSHSLASVHVGN